MTWTYLANRWPRTTGMHGHMRACTTYHTQRGMHMPTHTALPPTQTPTLACSNPQLPAHLRMRPRRPHAPPPGRSGTSPGWRSQTRGCASPRWGSPQFAACPQTGITCLPQMQNVLRQLSAGKTAGSQDLTFYPPRSHAHTPQGHGVRKEREVKR